MKVEKLEASSGEPSAISNVDAAGFLTIQRTLRQVFPEVLVAPALLPRWDRFRALREVVECRLSLLPPAPSSRGHANGCTA